MTRKEPPAAAEAHELRRYERESCARTIAAEFSNVRNIRIAVRFKDADGQCDPEPQTRAYSPAMKAFFEIKCPFRECVLGGISFGDAVAEAVRGRQRKASGEATCSGWQDRERINKHACMLKASYEVDITYGPE